MKNNDWIAIDVLEDYLDGKLDAKTMHQIEKISLEDVFVAEALAGLSQSPKRSQTLSLLQKQLQQRVDQKPVLQSRWRITSQRLSIASAAAVLFIAVSVLFWMKTNKQQDKLAKQAKKIEVNIAPQVATTKPPAQEILPAAPELATAALAKNNFKKLAKPQSIAPVTDAFAPQTRMAKSMPVMASLSEVDVNKPIATTLKPEPVNGWDSYRDYLKNNNNLIKSGLIGKVVELSFQVDTNGTPININVIKSAGEEYDKEAIRLLTDGPKWGHLADASNSGTLMVEF